MSIKTTTPFSVTPIGVVHSEWTDPKGTPIQPGYAAGHKGTIEVWPEYVAGLADLEGFERIWLIYWFHKAPAPRLRLVPFRDTVERGLFATRAPCRPNPLGLSSLRLGSIEDNVLHVDGVDILDGTPVLDIKPYAPDFDHFDVSRYGWLQRTAEDRTHADNRFEREAHPEKRT